MEDLDTTYLENIIADSPNETIILINETLNQENQINNPIVAENLSLE